MDYEKEYIKYKYKYLMLKYGGVDKALPPIPVKYNDHIRELYRLIKKFFNEVTCCEQELDISTIEAINKHQKQFLGILKPEFGIVKDKINPPIDLIPIKDSAITVAHLSKYLSEDLFDNLLYCITEYATFINTLFVKISEEGIPFYKIHPLKRINNENLKPLYTEPCTTGITGPIGPTGPIKPIDNCYSCSKGTAQSINDCYTLIITQGIIRIKMQIETIIGFIKSDPKHTKENLFQIEDFHSKLEKQIKYMNSILDRIDKYNQANVFCIHPNATEKRVIFGDMTIYDKNICLECKRKDCCKDPCIFSKSKKPPCAFKTKNI